MEVEKTNTHTTNTHNEHIRLNTRTELPLMNRSGIERLQELFRLERYAVVFAVFEVSVVSAHRAPRPNKRRQRVSKHQVKLAVMA